VPEVSAAAYRLLALCAELPLDDARRSMMVDKVRRAERSLSSIGGVPPDLQALARNLGWGYSYFRRVFKEQTGLSPWQYHLQSRLGQARRWIASSDLTLDEVAERSGFASAFHLSNAFKKTFGESPGALRNNARRRT
jgi:AraC-like DNA-binding protein